MKKAWRYLRAVPKLESLDVGPRSVLSVLSGHVDDDGFCYLKRATIATRCNISRRSVTRHIDALIELGYVQKASRFYKHGGQKENGYTLVLDKLEADMVKKPQRGGALVSPPQGADDSPPVSPVSRGEGAPVTPIERPQERPIERPQEKLPLSIDKGADELPAKPKINIFEKAVATLGEKLSPRLARQMAGKLRKSMTDEQALDVLTRAADMVDPTSYVSAAVQHRDVDAAVQEFIRWQINRKHPWRNQFAREVAINNGSAFYRLSATEAKALFRDYYLNALQEKLTNDTDAKFNT